ncbi:hypothetical protein TNIN_263521 [Trichonephila inaurata madagascariensis]|uniref:Uncharacterized protein n=1 Tax=Trichonephila inaurata madagascariensis TaxID=2747483 RepID=A0A8X6IEW8_9ARAC|nr:hypothetical protein TNIN_263521 [Trichonephila inaurata madagascariensis]
MSRTSSTPSEALSVQVKAPKCELRGVGKRTSQKRAEGVGVNEGSEGRSCCAEARPTFPDVVDRFKKLFWEMGQNRSDHLTQPGNRSDFNTPPQQLAGGRSLTGVYTHCFVP